MRIVLDGELDLSTVETLSEELAAHARRGARIVVDLRGLSFMDSSGLSALLGARAAAERDGWELALIPGPAPIAQLFELTDTAQLFCFLDGRAEPE